MVLCWGLAHTPAPGAEDSQKLSSMKPKGGAKCSRRPHSLWSKCLESRKRVTLGRKRFWSQGDLEALIFTESGQVYMQEDGSGRERPRKAMAKGWLGGGGGGRGWLGGGGGGRGRKQASKLGRRRSLLPLSSCSQGLLAPPRHRSSQPTVVRRAPREPVVLSPQGKCIPSYV